MRASLLTLLLCSALVVPLQGLAVSFPPDGPPDWTDEAPAVSQLLESGYAAMNGRQWSTAATRYCAAARLGSVEAYYRLGRLLSERPDPYEREQGAAALGVAAQRGHLKAQSLLNELVASDALPDCLWTGEAPVWSAVGDAHLMVVPSDVVDRYVLALPSDKRRHALMIQRLAPSFQVDGRLALAIARAESNLNPTAVSDKNAQGLMQLIPDTAARFGVRNPMDPEQNVRGGLAYLRWLLTRFDGDVALTSAAYNAGENAVDRHGGVPPYAETREYVQRILHFYRSPIHARP